MDFIISAAVIQNNLLEGNGNFPIVLLYSSTINNLLINENKLSEVDIETAKANVPELWYNFEGVRRRHFVDIYIKSKKTCIEVKSEWTLKKHYNKVFEKQKGAINDGYKYIIIVVLLHNSE
jgi:hypothetical protein